MQQAHDAGNSSLRADTATERRQLLYVSRKPLSGASIAVCLEESPVGGAIEDRRTGAGFATAEKSDAADRGVRLALGSGEALVRTGCVCGGVTTGGATRDVAAAAMRSPSSGANPAGVAVDELIPAFDAPARGGTFVGVAGTTGGRTVPDDGAAVIEKPSSESAAEDWNTTVGSAASAAAGRRATFVTGGEFTGAGVVLAA